VDAGGDTNAERGQIETIRSSIIPPRTRWLGHGGESTRWPGRRPSLALFDKPSQLRRPWFRDR